MTSLYYRKKGSIYINEIAVNLKILFKQVPDKTNAWNDLLTLLPKLYGNDQKVVVKLLGAISKYT